MDVTLVVMAAGMGSRYGGLKQMEQVTPDGKCLVDFSVYDAVKAGFNKVVFVLRQDIYNNFVSVVGKRIEKRVNVEYVLQDDSNLPQCRTKPFGTGQAVLCCKGIVNEPFAVINADDYYGVNAFEDIYKHLTTAKQGEYATVLYTLANTVSNNGAVSRGICNVANGYLQSIVEEEKLNSNFVSEVTGNKYSADTQVSMNLFGFTTNIFNLLEDEYKKFIATANLLTDELRIPSVVAKAITSGYATVKAFCNSDKWYGMTYNNDLDEVKQAINNLIAQGYYKDI